jgi:hypothetical protein
MHTHPYEYTHTNHTSRSIFEDGAGKSSRLTKSPQTSRCRRERRLPLKAQTPLNLEKFALTGSRTQDLRCYWGSCNHYATDPFAACFYLTFRQKKLAYFVLTFLSKRHTYTNRGNNCFDFLIHFFLCI